MKYELNLDDKSLRILILVAAITPSLIFGAGFLTASTHYKNLTLSHQGTEDTIETAPVAQEILPAPVLAISRPEQEITPAPAVEPIPEPAPPAALAPAEEYSVQVAAFKNEPNALKFAARLQDRGYPAEVVQLLTGEATPLYRVVYGHFEQREQAHIEASIFALREKSKAMILERS